jgi:uncharacterized protein with HEPN domain
MRPEIEKRIWDALYASRRIQDFTAGLDYTAFAASALIRAAVERQFEIIGEALNKASSADESLAYKIPDVPRIIGLRNRLIHGYDAVDDQLVWDIVRSKIPPLIDALEKMIGES